MVRESIQSSRRRLVKKRERLRAPSMRAVMQVAFDLSRELSLELREEEMIGAFTHALSRLLPGRLFCLRVVDPRSLNLTSLVASDAVAPDLGRAPLRIKRSVLRQTRLSAEAKSSGRIQIVERWEPTFFGSAAGFSVPLVGSGRLFGLLNIEYRRKSPVCGTDEAVVIPLANQLSVALCNLDLLGEARYYRDYLRQIIDVGPALIVVIDREARIAVTNAAMQRYVGLTEDVVGRPLMETRRKSGASEPSLGHLLAEGLSGREFTDREVTITRADGQTARAVFNTSVLRAADGTIDGVIGIGQELDRIRSLERQVIQAEKLATLGQLAAGVVHELNNPLTSISVYADYLVQRLDRETPADADKARKIVEGASRIQKLTRDLITYARPAGEWQFVSINEVVRTALVFCEHVIRRAEAVIELELQDDLPQVRAIPTQLHQVLINLVTNACHALPDAGQKLKLRTSLDEDGRVTVEVADSGVGIHELDRAHIFDPFFTTKTDGHGTGLGLSIVKNIVEGHRGQVDFQSRPGEGTTFYVSLPVVAESRATTPATTPATTKEESA